MEEKKDMQAYHSKVLDNRNTNSNKTKIALSLTLTIPALHLGSTSNFSSMTVCAVGYAIIPHCHT